MKLLRFILSILFIFGLVSCSNNSTDEVPQKTIELTVEELNKTLSESIAKIYSYDNDKTTKISQGTAFFVDTAGTFITNYHVIDGAYYLKLFLPNGKSSWIDKVYTYNNNSSDFAVCHAEKLITTPVSFSKKYLEKQTVFSYGFPNDASSPVIKKGTIIGSTTKDSSNLIENTAIIDHGSSGGILSDNKGNVLGITTCEFPTKNYGAVPYSAFADSLKKDDINKTPFELFHRSSKIQLTTTNFETYFKPEYVKITDSKGFTSFKIYFKANKVFSIPVSIYVSYQVVVTYEYYIQKKGTTQNQYYTKDIRDLDGVTIYNHNKSSAYILLQPDLNNYDATIINKSWKFSIYSATGAIEIAS